MIFTLHRIKSQPKRHSYFLRIVVREEGGVWCSYHSDEWRFLNSGYLYIFRFSFGVILNYSSKEWRNKFYIKNLRTSNKAME